MATSLTACITSSTSSSHTPDGTAEVILAPKADVLAAARAAILRTFPFSTAAPLPKPDVGYSWRVQPGIDVTTIRMQFTPQVGDSPDKGRVSGWGYTITSSGTHAFAETRFITPFVGEFQGVLQERDIPVVMLNNVTDDRGTGSTGATGDTDATGVASGTGFFVSKDGYLLTNHHVIDKAKKIEVTTSDKQKHPATVISSDASNDVALLKIDAITNPLPVIAAADIKRGTEVFTLGYPIPSLQGQELKATYGRVNALSGIHGDIRYFQIDVPIQPGNSGGPLITDQGQVIGIVSASLNGINTLRTTGAMPQNVNYAVKSEYIQPLLRFATITGQAAKPASGALKNPDAYESSVVFIESYLGP
ncbi:S1C family serine protease [Insolitispirillum peregrinum]|uniref:S1C family serine protease n=1 Tax=Insolitispirillum peregrinum TaxID=80876 RepID=UPI00158D6524|nr:trypsin-like peptidase domain-containing protein [Insolitispirillum peregrinum]